MRLVVLVAALLAAGCASAPEKKTEAPPPPPPVQDDTALLPAANRTGAKLVPNHLLGIDALPGGTIGEYEAGRARYQLFIIQTDTPQDAAILLLNVKVALQDATYISYMGGYFGAGQAGTVYAFAKGRYLAGVVGLAEAKADPIARQLAAQLH
jgi:hypothetical protein